MNNSNFEELNNTEASRATIIQGLPADANPFSEVPPPPDGIHIVRLSLSTSKSPTGCMLGTTWQGERFIEIHLMLEVLAEGTKYDKHKMFDIASTLTRRGQGNRMVEILKALGEPVEKPMEEVLSAKRLVVALQKQPLCRITSQWIARTEAPQGTWRIKRGMTKFPRNPDGSYNHEIVYRVKAKAEVLRYLPLAGQRPVSA